MKITLPSGVIVEGEPEEVAFALRMVAPEIAAVAEGKNSKSSWLQEVLDSLTGRQRDTYDVLHQSSGKGVHVSHIAKVLEITDQAAGQRCRDLIDMSLAERVERGVYRAIRK